MEREMRRIGHGLTPLILALALVLGGLATVTTHARADYFPGEQSPPPQGGGIGDPDWPDGKSPAPMPRPGVSRGALDRTAQEFGPARVGAGAKWLWGLRWALSSLLRVFFRY
jgi:hypothetical protein